MTIGLKSCPFCGGNNLEIKGVSFCDKPIPLDTNEMGAGLQLYRVECGDCYAEGPPRPFREADATEEWNIRSYVQNCPECEGALDPVEFEHQMHFKCGWNTPKGKELEQMFNSALKKALEGQHK